MTSEESNATLLDPVCGMRVPLDAPLRAEHDGQTYGFCCPSCLERFRREPDRYLRSSTGDGLVSIDLGHVEAPPGAQWTCPMHPEILRAGPGSCPKCGMALEPTVAGAASDEQEGGELRDMQRRLLACAALTAPLVVLAMGQHVSGWPLAEADLRWVDLALATPVVLWGGWPFFQRGWYSLVHRSLNMFTLIALGVGVAYLYSLAAVIAPGAFPESARDAHGNVGLYFEPAAVIVTLVLLGQVLELRARRRTSSALRALLELAPPTARRLRPDGGEEDVDLGSVIVGDRLRVRPGEKVPVDGVVESGESAVDESLVTGESMPVDKVPGAAVIGGSLNTTGSFVVRAERVGADSLLAQIVQLVSDAQRSRAPIQQLADRIAGWFVPVVVAVAVVAFGTWLLVGPEPALGRALVAAVSVLIIACPCALGLATPMSVTVAMGRAARSGILFRSAEALQVLRSVDTLVVDKTGTLTEGRPRLVDVEIVSGGSEPDVLRLIASLERGSEHPLARAIVEAERGAPAREAERFESRTGLGVVGTVEGHDVAVGSARLLAELGVDTASMERSAQRLRERGRTALLVAVDGKPAGVLGLADTIKPTTPEALAALRDAGVRVVMLTGDGKVTAESVARELGIDEVHAEVLPDDKREVVRRLQAQGSVVAMAGDGVNDAPALSQADVGIAMGTGADVAMESAGVTLVKGDLRGIARARRISEATVRNIRQNLAFAFGYNALGIPIAAGMLYPTFGIVLSPAIAAAAMSFSSVSVIANSLRLQAVNPDSS